MKHVISLIAMMFFFGVTASNAQQAERTSIAILVPGGTPCEPIGQPNTNPTDGRLTGNQLINLENFTDYVLPNPVYIVGSQVWVDGVDPLGDGTHGNLPFLVDPQKAWSISAGYPIFQHAQVKNLKNIGTLQLFPHGQQLADFTFNPPVAYRSGDGIAVAPECNSNTSPLLPTYFTVHLQATQDFVGWTLPTALLSVAADTPVGPGTPAGGQSPYHLRMLVPGPSFHATKIRARVKANFAQLTATRVTHMAVGLENGNGPDMQGAPVQLNFNGQTGGITNPGNFSWTDWTPLDMPAGQPIIIAASIWTAGTSNAWTLTASPNGNGMWYSGTVDSWNSASMGGSITFQPLRTDVFDLVQVQ